MKKFIVIALLVIVGLVLAVALCGAMLPAKHSVSRTLVIHQPSQMVWMVLADHASDPSWRPDVASVKKLDNRNGHPVWEEHYKNGQSMRLETTVLDFQGAAERMERKIVDQSSFGGVWVYELTPQDDPSKPGGKMTTVKITENGEVYNPIFRFVGRFIIGNDTTLNTYMKNLAKKFGE